MSNARMTFAMCILLGACGDDGSGGEETQEREPSTARDGGGGGDGDNTRDLDAAAGSRDAGTQPRDAGSTPVADASASSDAGTNPSADAGTTRDAGADAGSAPMVPTFGQVYTIIAADCRPCHTAEDDGDLDMSSRRLAFDNLVNEDASGSACAGDGRVRVVPGDAEESLLVQKLEGTQDCGDRMPRGRTALPQAQIELIKAWIEGGANDDYPLRP